MSDAPAAPVTTNGVLPSTQEKTEEVPSFKVENFFHCIPLPFILTFELSIKVFAGNLAYSTTDEGLKAFFAPVHNDMCVIHGFCSDLSS
jgi:hypothetical protein